MQDPYGIAFEIRLTNLTPLKTACVVVFIHSSYSLLLQKGNSIRIESIDFGVSWL